MELMFVVSLLILKGRAMSIAQQIINGLSVFEKYNENTRPYIASSESILSVQKVEFGDALRQRNVKRG